MKKTFLTLLLATTATTAMAQQVQGDFDKSWVNCIPWSSDTKLTAQGTQPVGWNISNVKSQSTSASKTTVGFQEVPGADGKGYAVQLKNVWNVVQAIPAYITLGTPWNTSTVIGTTPSNKDGGTWGGIAFTYRPDAVSFKYKCSNNSENARISVIGYTWTGSTSQAEVPANIAFKLTTIGGSPKATTTTMSNRDIHILEKNDLDHTSLGGEVTDNHTLLSSFEHYITEPANDWTEKTIEFTYKNSKKMPEMLNLIFSASDYFKSSVTKDVTFTIDDVQLVYYHQLKSLKIDGTDYTAKLVENGTADLSDIYYVDGKTEVSWTEKGVAAKATKSWDATSRILTITVTGDDKSTSSYKLQFSKKNYSGQLSSLKVGNENIALTEGVHYYTLVGKTYDASASNFITAEKTSGTDDEVTLKGYDESKGIYTINVNAGPLSSNYYVKFAKVAKDYNSKLFIGMNGILSTPTQAVGIANSTAGKVDLQLRNFYFSSYNMGDIFVDNITATTNADGSLTLSKSLNASDNFRIFGDAGAGLILPYLDLTGTLKDGRLTANLEIYWDATGSATQKSDCSLIRVKVFPTDAASINISEADFAGVGTYVAANAEPNAVSIRQGLTNPNAVIFLNNSEEQNVKEEADKANVVIDGATLSTFTLGDGSYFSLDNNFTAQSVNYTRAFNTTNGYVSSFVLPFGFTVPQGVTVAQLSKVKGNYLVFDAVTKTEANKPYVVITNNANFINSLTNVSVMATTNADLTTSVTGASHVGSYVTKQVQNVYGYADGQFVKVNSGTVNPFRTYITLNSLGSAPKAFNISINNGGTTTGINTLVDAAKAAGTVYNLQGIRMNGSLSTLPKGVYVVNGKRIVK